VTFIAVFNENRTYLAFEEGPIVSASGTASRSVEQQADGGQCLQAMIGSLKETWPHDLAANQQDSLR
jgi:hypothetical protein